MLIGFFKKFLGKFLGKKVGKFLEEVDHNVSLERDDFNVKGTKNEFIVKFYNNQVEFFIRQGVIIGVRDKRKSNKIFYYEKEEQIND